MDLEKEINEKKWDCQLIENALNDPEWDQEINEELCMGECNTCPHRIPVNNKLGEIVDALCDHFEDKQLRQARLEFISYVMNSTLEKTNQELSEANLLDFMTLLQEKDHYQEEFKEALFLFEKNLRDNMEKIIYDIINGMMED